ncbi:hypothetical protein IEO21_01752 [Rhodonia placenta]|uniref:Uncharacterized protein n=1 Tax=Rhodonia placenta TaxID=104341 RepID=A0A8H7P8S4_9APHY|nr:hypothetical protein IEO21_01752 [Postia placenta]
MPSTQLRMAALATTPTNITIMRASTFLLAAGHTTSILSNKVKRTMAVALELTVSSMMTPETFAVASHTQGHQATTALCSVTNVPKVVVIISRHTSFCVYGILSWALNSLVMK